jgi:hypothetical protein
MHVPPINRVHYVRGEALSVSMMWSNLASKPRSFFGLDEDDYGGTEMVYNARASLENNKG